MPSSPPFIPATGTKNMSVSSKSSSSSSSSTSPVINYSEDPYFLLRDRIELHMSKPSTFKDIKMLETDLFTLKQTIDSVLESPFLFPHINTSVELPQRMAFYQSMSARLSALKKEANGIQERDTQNSSLTSSSTNTPPATMTTIFHFEPSPDQHRQLDHLVSIVGNVKDQALQISNEIDSHKRFNFIH